MKNSYEPINTILGHVEIYGEMIPVMPRHLEFIPDSTVALGCYTQEELDAKNSLPEKFLAILCTSEIARLSPYVLPPYDSCQTGFYCYGTSYVTEEKLKRNEIGRPTGSKNRFSRWRAVGASSHAWNEFHPRTKDEVVVEMRPTNGSQSQVIFVIDVSKWKIV